jgi:hypothetical protein
MGMMAGVEEKMGDRVIDRNAIRDDEDWEGNNAAFTCPNCKKVFIVSGLLHDGRRKCPNPKCGKSVGWVRGGKGSGGSAGIEWQDYAGVERQGH